MRLSPVKIVIVLLLMPSASNAQVDSNSIVTLLCSGYSAGCSFTLSCTDKSQENGSGHLSVSFDSSFRYADRGQGSVFGLPSFELDTVAKVISNLMVAKYQSIYDYGFLNPVGFSLIILKFGPIPFHRNGNGIAIDSAQYPCFVVFNAFRQYGIHGVSCMGGCADSEFVSTSLSLDIHPRNDAITVSGNLHRTLTMYPRATDELCSFEPLSFMQFLEVSNRLGVIVQNIQVLAGESSKILHLPPGCYFARLGNEVAKFVVMP